MPYEEDKLKRIEGIELCQWDYECKFCDGLFETMSEFVKHLWKLHPEIMKARTENLSLGSGSKLLPSV